MVSIDLNDHLLNGEKIIWSGRPAQGLLLTARDWIFVPFSLIWVGFAIFWETTTLGFPKAPLFMKLWGVPFILIGLYLVVGRLLLDAWIRQGVHYAITNKRILISRPAPFAKLIALNFCQLPETSLNIGAAGRGTIRFGQASSYWGGGNGFSSWTPSLDPTPQFIAIENAREVFTQIQRANQRSHEA